MKRSFPTRRISSSRHSNPRWLAAAAWLALGVAACGADDSDPEGDSEPEAQADSEPEAQVNSEPEAQVNSEPETQADAEPPQVSYQRDVAPLFAGRCTYCHHSNAAIGINIADPFDPENGLVGSVNTWAAAYPEGGTPNLNVERGDPDESFLIDKISDPNIDVSVAGNFMPWNIPKLSETQIATLRQWISDGALNDEVFTNQVRPIFGTEGSLGNAGGNCTYCHYAGGLPPNLTDPFDPDTGAVGVASLLRPDMSRITPGDPDNSFLIVKLELGKTGTRDGSPMPPAFEAFTEDEIATVRDWIAEGALDN